ncbi:DUF4185 domain-containing protein [Streptomyces sp. NPDC051940]|uniref:DUF4185 domain-containing protein n=1 Tax=Streptomyces sp. NPDC051940 TaxID=3155675 RepID=UPI003448AF15
MTTATSRRRSRAALAAALVVVAAGCAEPGGAMLDPEPRPAVLAGVRDVQRVTQLTGADSPNRTDRFHVHGTDLGSMFEAAGRTWFVFGDTFGPREDGKAGAGGDAWRSNVLAYTDDTDPSDGIRLDGFIADDIGWAKELLPSRKADGQEMTVIPTYGFEAGGAMYLAYMSVRHWGEPGEWEANHAGLAKSTDQGRTWTKLDAPRWPGTSNFIQVSVAEVDGDLYFWGVPHGRFGGVRLMRVPEQDVEDPGAYRYFAGTAGTGRPRWSPDAAKAETVVDDTVGELSVVWNEHLSRWLMTYTDGGGGGAAIREGSTPWGPWREKFTLVSSQDVPGLYSPYMLPRYTADGGWTIYFTLSVWGPYNVYWYKADLISGKE